MGRHGICDSVYSGDRMKLLGFRPVESSEGLHCQKRIGHGDRHYAEIHKTTYGSSGQNWSDFTRLDRAELRGM